MRIVHCQCFKAELRDIPGVVVVREDRRAFLSTGALHTAHRLLCQADYEVKRARVFLFPLVIFHPQLKAVQRVARELMKRNALPRSRSKPCSIHPSTVVTSVRVLFDGAHHY